MLEETDFLELPQHAIDILLEIKLDVNSIYWDTEGWYEIELASNIDFELDLINRISAYPEFRGISESDNGNLEVFITG